MAGRRRRTGWRPGRSPARSGSVHSSSLSRRALTPRPMVVCPSKLPAQATSLKVRKLLTATPSTSAGGTVGFPVVVRGGSPGDDADDGSTRNGYWPTRALLGDPGNVVDAVAGHGPVHFDHDSVEARVSAGADTNEVGVPTDMARCLRQRAPRHALAAGAGLRGRTCPNDGEHEHLRESETEESHTSPP